MKPRHIALLTVALLAMPLLCGAEPAGTQPGRTDVAGTSTESKNNVNKEKPMSNDKERTMIDLTDTNAWEVPARWPGARLTQEKAGFVIESETTQPEGPGVISYGVIATRERHGAPGLRGTLIFEVDFVDYTNNAEYLNKYMSAIGQPSDHEDPVFGLYLMGWGITIGNLKGFVTGMDDGDRKRAVQFHFDSYSKWGFGSCMNRQISTQDQQKYPRFTQKELMESTKDYFAGKETYEAWARRVMPYRSMNDSTALSARHYPLDKSGTGSSGVIQGRSWGHRYGIMLSDDGNTFSWLLDGKVMDSCDITGYFSSSTDDFADGVYISIGGGAGFRKNLWQFANPRLTVKP